MAYELRLSKRLRFDPLYSVHGYSVDYRYYDGTRECLGMVIRDNKSAALPWVATSRRHQSVHETTWLPRFSTRIEAAKSLLPSELQW